MRQYGHAQLYNDGCFRGLCRPRSFFSLASRSDPLRGEVDAFLLESLVAEEIYEQNGKGVVMPHRDVLFCYVQFASFLPDTCEVLRRVRYLVDHPNYSVQWGRHFRVRWHLEHNVLPKAKPLEGDDLSTRVWGHNRISVCYNDMFTTGPLTKKGGRAFFVGVW